MARLSPLAPSFHGTWLRIQFARESQHARLENASSTNEMLAKAKDDMEQYFSFVGLTNYFDESLLLLRRILRWRKPPFYIKAKVSPPQSEHSRADLNLIEAHNELDSALYDYAEARFADVLAEARPWLDQELPRFRRMNQC